MINANLLEVEHEGILLRFLQGIPALADKAILTKVYRCSSFSQLVTELGQTGPFYIGFKPNDSTSAASSIYHPSETISQGPNFAHAQVWRTFPNNATHWNTGGYDPTQRLYSPLATLRQIRPKAPTLGFRSRLPPPIADNDAMDAFIPPWGELDEQGEEMDGDD